MLRRKPAPEGWDTIAPVIEALEAKMRAAEKEPTTGKRKAELLWPIYRLHHQKSRFVYEMYYQDHLISKELYDYCLREKIIDGELIAKWKKCGYEKLCCLKCMSTQATQFGSTCICRVPPSDLPPGQVVECITCGCRGCASNRQ